MIGYLVLHDHHSWAIGLFAYAGITDLVDGWIARRWKLQTVVGTVIDPMADKILMTVLVGCLAWKGSMPGMYAGVRHRCSPVGGSILIPSFLTILYNLQSGLQASSSPAMFSLALPLSTIATSHFPYQRLSPATGTSPFLAQKSILPV